MRLLLGETQSYVSDETQNIRVNILVYIQHSLTDIIYVSSECKASKLICAVGIVCEV